MNIGTAIKTARGKRTAKWLAEAAKCSETQIRNIEAGKHSPSADLLDRIGKVLGIAFVLGAAGDISRETQAAS